MVRVDIGGEGEGYVREEREIGLLIIGVNFEKFEYFFEQRERD
jgi:hypothetical protein